jgi:hypothetical protein
MKMSRIALLWSLAAALALHAGVSRAQAPAAGSKTAPPDALTEKTRQLYDEGRKAFAASHWAEAHASFLAAWKLTPHYQIAANLGTTEVLLGKHRDAAEHLSWYLREAPAVKAEARREAEAQLKEALAKVGSITVEVAPAGAEVTVDGASVGKAPLASPVFLDPGEHEIAAKLDGYASTRGSVTARAGAAGALSLRLEPAAAPASPGRSEVQKGVGGPDKRLVYTGLGVTGAAAGVGAVFGVLSLLRTGDADERYAEVRKEGGEYACSLGQRAAKCNALVDLYEDAAAFTKVSWIGFGSAATAGAATLIYSWMATPPKAGEPARVQAIPLIARGGGGVVMTGAW